MTKLYLVPSDGDYDLYDEVGIRKLILNYLDQTNRTTFTIEGPIKVDETRPVYITYVTHDPDVDINEFVPYFVIEPGPQWIPNELAWRYSPTRCEWSAYDTEEFIEILNKGNGKIVPELLSNLTAFKVQK